MKTPLTGSMVFGSDGFEVGDDPDEDCLDDLDYDDLDYEDVAEEIVSLYEFYEHDIARHEYEIASRAIEDDFDGLTEEGMALAMALGEDIAITSKDLSAEKRESVKSKPQSIEKVGLKDTKKLRPFEQFVSSTLNKHPW